MRTKIKSEGDSLLSSFNLTLNKEGIITSISDDVQVFFESAQGNILHKPLSQYLDDNSCQAFESFIRLDAFKQTILKLTINLGSKSYLRNVQLVKDGTGITVTDLGSNQAYNEPISQEDKQLKINSLKEELSKTLSFLNQIGKTAKIGGWELYLDNMHLIWSDETYHIHELPVGTEVKLEDAIQFYHPLHTIPKYPFWRHLTPFLSVFLL